MSWDREKGTCCSKYERLQGIWGKKAIRVGGRETGVAGTGARCHWSFYTGLRQPGPAGRDRKIPGQIWDPVWAVWIY